MPTNILRKRNTKVSEGAQILKPQPPLRRILVTASGIEVQATLKATLTADRIWAALPLFSTVETWGQAVHFEVPIETGRETGAITIADTRSLYFWPDEHRIMMVFGKTPVSKRGEKRLPVPCNVWADTSDDLTQLRHLTPGEKIGLKRIEAFA